MNLQVNPAPAFSELFTLSWIRSPRRSSPMPQSPKHETDQTLNPTRPSEYEVQRNSNNDSIITMTPTSLILPLALAITRILQSTNSNNRSEDKKY